MGSVLWSLGLVYGMISGNTDSRLGVVGPWDFESCGARPKRRGLGKPRKGS